MRTWSFILAFLMTAPVFAVDWAQVTCPGDKVLAEELLKAEVGGRRVRGAKLTCLKQELFPYIKMQSSRDRVVVDDTTPLLVDDKTPFVIEKVITTEHRRVEIQFRWVGVDGKKSDLQTVLFRKFKGGAKETLGCAGIVAHADVLALKKSCQ